jgi:hypothetical protein
MEPMDTPSPAVIDPTDPPATPAPPHSRRRAVIAVLAVLGVLLAGAGAGWLASGQRPGGTAPPGVPGPASAVAPGGSITTTNRIDAYVRAGCPRCAAAKEFLPTLVAERPGLIVVYHDVVADKDARAALETLVVERGLAAVSVPVFVIGNSVIVGFTGPKSTGDQIRSALDGATVMSEDHEFGACSADESSVPSSVDVPFLGSVSASKLGLPMFTVVLGLVDGFNPCAMWVLLFMLSMLVNLHDRRKMFIIAGTFVVVSGVVYLAFMAAWLHVFMIIGFSRIIQIILGAFALVVGFANVKDFFAFKRGPSLSIPESRKPEIYRRARSILRAENMLGALVGVAALAVMVNLVELLCTAGLPAVYTQVLASRHLPLWQYYAYLVGYIVFYMLDDSIMVIIAVVTLSQSKLQEKGGRALKLVSGAVMLLLALMLLFKPEWLAALG